MIDEQFLNQCSAHPSPRQGALGATRSPAPPLGSWIRTMRSFEFLETIQPQSLTQKSYARASRLMASWMQASAMKAARVSARFS